MLQPTNGQTRHLDGVCLLCERVVQWNVYRRVRSIGCDARSDAQLFQRLVCFLADGFYKSIECDSESTADWITLSASNCWSSHVLPTSPVVPTRPKLLLCVWLIGCLPSCVTLALGLASECTASSGKSADVKLVNMIDYGPYETSARFLVSFYFGCLVPFIMAWQEMLWKQPGCSVDKKKNK